MKTTHLMLALLCAAGSLFTSCKSTKTPESVIEQQNFESAYEKFVQTTKGYPAVMSCYIDEELLKQASHTCPIYICLSQQRGRLYVNNQVAMDWPVSTGTSGHPTPTGKYKILSKDVDHVSASYGRLYNASGRCINSNATPATPVPEGGKFVGSPMPYYLQLTWDGVGMHTGKVVAGRRLSHGCIRTPNIIAKRLFNIARVGTRTTICQSVESAYPVFKTRPLTDEEHAKIEQARKEAEAKAAAEKKNA